MGENTFDVLQSMAIIIIMLKLSHLKPMGFSLIWLLSLSDRSLIFGSFLAV